jgi:hypothetical protein
MTTPTRQQIIEKALEQYHYANPHILTNPTEDELSENGFLFTARSELMVSESRKNAEWLEQDKKPIETESLTVDIEEAMKTGIYISGTSNTGKSDLGMEISDSMMSKGIIVLAVDVSGDWAKRSNIPNVVKVSAVTDFSLSVSTVFDTSALTVMQQREFIEKLCAAIWIHQTTVYPRKRIFLWLEEGHISFPLNAFQSKKYAEATRLVSVGRNIDVRIGVITQFASLLSKDVMKYMKQRYFSITNEPNDVDYIAKMIGKEDAQRLRTVQNGQFIYSVNGNNRLIEIQPHEQTEQPILVEQQNATAEQGNQLLGYCLLGLLFVGIAAIITLVLR